MPARVASATVRLAWSRPSMRIVPALGAVTPPRIFIIVDLPAPFSPIRPSTSPRSTRRLTLSSAVTPGYVLVIPDSSSSVSAIRRFLPARSPAARGRRGLVRAGCLLAEQRLQFRGEVSHVRLVDHLGRDDQLAVGRNPRLVALQRLDDVDRRQVAELERLLHDRGLDGAIGDAAQRALVFVEADDLDLAGL